MTQRFCPTSISQADVNHGFQARIWALVIPNLLSMAPQESPETTCQQRSAEKVACVAKKTHCVNISAHISSSSHAICLSQLDCRASRCKSSVPAQQVLQSNIIFLVDGGACISRDNLRIQVQYLSSPGKKVNRTV